MIRSAKWVWLLLSVAILRFFTDFVNGQGAAGGVEDIEALLKDQGAKPLPAVKAQVDAVGVPADPAVAPVVAAPAVEPVVAPVVAAPAVEPVVAPVVAAPAVEPVVAPVVAAPAVAPAVVPASPRDNLVSELMTLEALRRKALDEHGMASLKSAKQLLRDGDYEEAKIQFELALTYIGDRIETRPMRDEARDGVRESLYRQAMLLWKKGDRERAVQLARQANVKGHPQAAKLVASIQKEIENPPQPKKPGEMTRMLEKEYKDDREQVLRHMRRARQFYVVGEYDKAREEAEIVLRDHPFDTEAMELLERIGDKTYDISTTEFDATRTRMIRDVRDNWSPRRYAIDSVQPGGGGAVGPTASVQLIRGTGLTPEQAIAKKMRDIVIPEINFRQANINDVITFFESASRENDSSDTPPEKRGVNIVLKQNASSAPARAPSADPFATAAGAGDAGSAGGAPINVVMRYVSLFDALKIVTDVAGMKYRIKGNVVMIMPANMPDEDIVTRSYNVLPTLTDRIVGASRELGSKGGAGDGAADGGFMAAASDMSEKQDWKEFFKKMGVNWPDGSAISYMASIGKLRVSNTSENLAIFEQVLEELNVTPRQIEIEARFVEVAQEDLNSLGFEWTLNGDAYIGSGAVGSLAGSAIAPSGTIPVPQSATAFRDAVQAARPGGLLNRILNANPLTPRPVDADLLLDGGGTLSTSSRNMTKGVRFLSANGLGVGGTGVDDGIMKVTGAIDGNELSMILHALSQQSNTDLLSAPKVVTKSGQEAIMKVVEEYIYPTEFTVTALQSQNSTGANTATGSAVQPGGFETREVGVILQVIPEVSAEGQMINLIMNPQVVSEPSWKDYGYDMPNPTPGQPNIHLPMEQPFFKIRSISTSISIYNGATVVMGGMITEVRRANNDKVPFLGDIPYLGRLFQNKSERSEKRNLLIFVTARLVDPAGRAVKTSGEPSLYGDKPKPLTAVNP